MAAFAQPWQARENIVNPAPAQQQRERMHHQADLSSDDASACVVWQNARDEMMPRSLCNILTTPGVSVSLDEAQFIQWNLIFVFFRTPF